MLIFAQLLFLDKDKKMTQVIIYNQDNGIPAIVVPTPECLETHSIQEIAVKDVPAGKPFKIISAEELAGLENIPQKAWLINDADLTDGVGGESNEFN
jgi:hypothetical protein